MTAREAALTALERCRRDGAWSGSSIDGIIKKYALDRREAALAARLCLGVLQNSLLCDYYIGCYCSTEPKRLEPKLHDILMLGVYQILFLDRIPARAAVNESVALCRKCGMSRASGLANAVLRRIAENKSAGTLPDIPSEGGAEYLSIKYSHPEWLASRIISERGYDFAEAFVFPLRCSPVVWQYFFQFRKRYRHILGALQCKVKFQLLHRQISDNLTEKCPEVIGARWRDRVPCAQICIIDTFFCIRVI